MRRDVFENIQNSLCPDESVIEELLKKSRSIQLEITKLAGSDDASKKNCPDETDIEDEYEISEAELLHRRSGVLISAAAAVVLIAGLAGVLNLKNLDTTDSHPFANPTPMSSGQDFSDTVSSLVTPFEADEVIYYVKVNGTGNETAVTDENFIAEFEEWVERAVNDRETVKFEKGAYPQLSGSSESYKIRTSGLYHDKEFYIETADRSPSDYLDANSEPYRYIKNFSIAVGSDKSRYQLSRAMLKEFKMLMEKYSTILDADFVPDVSDSVSGDKHESTSQNSYSTDSGYEDTVSEADSSSAEIISGLVTDIDNKKHTADGSMTAEYTCSIDGDILYASVILTNVSGEERIVDGCPYLFVKTDAMKSEDAYSDTNVSTLVTIPAEGSHSFDVSYRIKAPWKTADVRLLFNSVLWEDDDNYNNDSLTFEFGVINENAEETDSSSAGESSAEEQGNT